VNYTFGPRPSTVASTATRPRQSNTGRPQPHKETRERPRSQRGRAGQSPAGEAGWCRRWQALALFALRDLPYCGPPSVRWSRCACDQHFFPSREALASRLGRAQNEKPVAAMTLASRRSHSSNLTHLCCVEAELNQAIFRALRRRPCALAALPIHLGTRLIMAGSRMLAAPPIRAPLASRFLSFRHLQLSSFGANSLDFPGTCLLHRTAQPLSGCGAADRPPPMPSHQKTLARHDIYMTFYFPLRHLWITKWLQTARVLEFCLYTVPVLLEFRNAISEIKPTCHHSAICARALSLRTLHATLTPSSSTPLISDTVSSPLIAHKCASRTFLKVVAFALLLVAFLLCSPPLFGLRPRK
jgi:hypothetical protein